MTIENIQLTPESEIRVIASRQIQSYNHLLAQRNLFIQLCVRYLFISSLTRVSCSFTILIQQQFISVYYQKCGDRRGSAQNNRAGVLNIGYSLPQVCFSLPSNQSQT
ncbi:Hypothetical_protein [Hexamita inflata]|uniref:Hypothetical_protein n=1 Tax=Hexamita inflata TaxID=28002 RepID=A0AA86NUV2_9EUKA|nr:Hypothetical protein HINF_LOCUS12819 [Hexamita inflata]CAI9925176.1 Hypothetical protein HINF_LOCUS12821 [Hexamita inflata]CAI9925177.1 Hypothetical protein HINF_LOCUS12822 [Hexamita inflata]